MKKSLPAVLLLAVLSGCAPTPPPVVSHRDDALKQLRAAEEAGIQAFARHDAGQAASIYAPDAALMLTNMPTVKGAAIASLLKEMMADPNFSMALVTDKVEATASGDLGYTRGTYTLTTTDPTSKKIMRESGKYLTVYAKQPDGSWKIVDDMSNPDGAAVPVETAK